MLKVFLSLGWSCDIFAGTHGTGVSVQFDGVRSCPVEVQLCTVLAEQFTRKDVLVMLQQSCRHQLCGVELIQTSVKVFRSLLGAIT